MSLGDRLALSSLKLHAHTFNTSMVVMMTCLLLYIVEASQVITLVVTMLILTTDVSDYHILIPMIVVIFFVSITYPFFSLPVYLLMVSIDQDSMIPVFRIFTKYSKKLLLYIGKTQIELIKPTFGSNSTDFFTTQIRLILQTLANNCWDARNDIFSYFSNIMDMTNTKAYYLRSNDIDATPQEITDAVLQNPSEIASKYRATAERYRGLIFVLFMGLASYVAGIQAFAACLMLLCVWLVQKPIRHASHQIIGNKGPPLKDGVYRIQTHGILPFLSSEGIGVVSGNVLHVPYHVCSANPIHIGNIVLKPHYVSIDRDLVTYGSAPKISAPKENMEVFINTEGELARTTYAIGKCYRYHNGTLVVPSVTCPGESGSPIFGREIQEHSTEKQPLVLLGLAGRYYGDSSGNASEFNELPIIAKENPNYEAIVAYPGFGKTRNIVINKLAEAFAKSTKKILLTGPTRVVCDELYKSVKEKCGYSISLNTKKSTHRNPFATIQISAHRTTLHLLSTGKIDPKHYSTIIIDEAHQEDAATILLRQYCRELQDIKLIEMSATLDGHVEKNSRYSITDVEIGKHDIPATISKSMEEGKRTMVFVTSMKNAATKDLIKKFKDFHPIMLSRETLESARMSLNDVDRKLIFSTDIAEIGINVPELEVVIDPMQKFTYKVTGNIVQPVIKQISEASHVQRRGRVGRTRPGWYYYIPNSKGPKFDNSDTIAHFDAKVISAGRSWSREHETVPFMLTDRQYNVWLANDMTPFLVHLLYDGLGCKRNRDQIQLLWKSLTGTGTMLSGCEILGCKCTGKYEYLDLRDHDFLFKQKN